MPGLNRCHPTLRQELLLKAILLRGPAATEALREWEKLLDSEPLDLHSLKLVPMLHRKLLAEGVTSPRAAEYEELYRCNQLRNLLLAARLSEVLEALTKAGIPVMLLKGFAVTRTYYCDPAVRYMEDFDLLVPSAHVAASLRALEPLGWRSSLGTDASPRTLALNYANGLSNPAGDKLDLHWGLLREGSTPEAQEQFWRGAVAETFDGHAVTRLNATDQLFHNCVNGIRVLPLPKLTWIADAVTILNAGPGLDWERLMQLVVTFHQTRVLASALEYLRTTFDAPVPDSILSKLGAHAASPLDRHLYAVKTGSHRGSGARIVFIWHALYAQSIGPIRSWSGLSDFVRFTRERFAIKTNGEYARFLFQRACRALTLGNAGPGAKNTTTQFLRSGR